MTLDAEDHTTLDSMFAIHEELRKDFPQTGCVIQAYLYRTEADARRLADAGSRVRLVKGAYKEPAEVAYQQKSETDKAYVRILRILMDGEGYPMIGSHDPRLISIAQEIARRAGRKPGEYEFQMLYGIRSDEHLRLRPRDTGCASTPRTGRTGTGTSCGDWRRSPPTCCFSPAACSPRLGTRVAPNAPPTSS